MTPGKSDEIFYFPEFSYKFWYKAADIFENTVFSGTLRDNRSKNCENWNLKKTHEENFRIFFCDHFTFAVLLNFV
eukprot:SAG11_NODE_22722_length_401_cov_0.821192_1_plen_74_part_01